MSVVYNFLVYEEQKDASGSGSGSSSGSGQDEEGM